MNLGPAPLALASLGLGSLSLYFYLKSITYDLSTDISEMFLFIRAKRDLDAKQSGDWRGIADTWEETVQRYRNKTAVVYVNDNVSYTFMEVNERANQVANWATNSGLKQGDVVALLMDNRPEFLWTWLGLAKIGVVISFINHNLTGKPLIHSLSVCKANYMIVGVEHSEKVLQIKSAFEEANANETYRWFSYGGHVSGMESMDDALEQTSNKTPSRDLRKGVTYSSNLLYIYTSGTTGLPKASVIKHLRYYTAAMVFSESYKVKDTDNNYCCLPLYHSAGGILGVGMTLYTGATMVLRKKFSNSSFWPDIVKHNCTVFQYIGELCRYLLAQPESEFDKAHNVRVAIGNGMRPDVWKKFQDRFNVPIIGEFYGATEGNSTLVNTRNKYPAVGYISPLLSSFFPLKIVKFDVRTEELIRDKNGFCIECKPDEVGELLGYIDDADVMRRFDGYTDTQATKKKVAHNVVKKGDRWFRSGDLLRRDKDGFYYFVDRIGDTFRWKGENVATGEVAEVISSFPGVLEVNVYGVTIPGHDGRAGMACMVLDEKLFDFNQFYSYISSNLPSYAQPIFLRVQPQIEITSTFKHVKSDLQKEGFNPMVITDKLYFRDENLKQFVPLTQSLYDHIQNQTIQSKL